MGYNLTAPVDATGVAYDMFIGLLRAGRTPEDAEVSMRAILPNEHVVQAAIQRFRDLTNKIVKAREPHTMRNSEFLTPWYTGARPADVFWPQLRVELKASLDEAAIESVDSASTKIVANLPPPWQREFSGRGLVIGYVQSGKTANYISVIAKAADAGYRLIVILSGIHNNLRKQTQRRMDRQLVELNKSSWFQLTDEEGDFGNPGNADALLAQDSLRLLAVVKKNKSRLENLTDWLASASAGAKSHCPILVIDDEADQASVNTSENERTTINELILKLLSEQKMAYVGYTATPFANIFVDPSAPEDLYPRDFVVDLPRPIGYFGPERLFGREPLTEEEAEEGVDGLDMILTVPDVEAQALRPPRKKEDRPSWEPYVPRSLRDAIRWFVLATAARRARGQSGKHSSMLVHTTQLAELHGKFKAPITAEVAQLADASELANLEALWNREAARVPATAVGEQPVTFEQVQVHIADVVGALNVVVDNYLSDERLDYDADRSQVVIVIGGNTLSRGLTLEGLVVSYFVRSANAYDTLLQMGRWFGYRAGYADLPRIWMTAELGEYFRFLATVEAEMRVDVERYELEDLTPKEFAVRVQTHPQLAITSALKMKSTERVQVSYSGRRLQTILFEHKDAKWLESNWAAGEQLVETIGGAANAESVGRGRKLWTSVPSSAIIQFLHTYNFHPNAQELVSDRIVEYIRRQNENRELVEWHVGLISREPVPEEKKASLSRDGFPVGLINRSAVKTAGKGYANIKSLMSREDRVMDLPGLTEEERARDDAGLQQLRPKKIGLLILYPIDRHSVPRTVNGEKKRVRTALDAERDVLGVGLVFPDAGKRESRVSYRAVALPLGDVDENDEPEPDVVDTEGSFIGEVQ